MSSTAPAPPTSIDVTSTPQVSFLTLLQVELRKAFDTRAGRWYTIGIVVLCAVVMLVQALLFEELFLSFSRFVQSMGGTLATFVPVILILLVTSEWSQRTGLVTFALEPRRSRVIAAKFTAGVLISLAVMGVAAALAALGVLVSTVRGISPDWDITVNQWQGFIVGTLAGVFVGFAFAMLLINSAASIVAFFVWSFVLPTLVVILGFAVGWFEELAPWIELNTALTPLFTGDFRADGEEWAQLATSGTIWLVIPLALGTWRLLRAEVK